MRCPGCGAAFQHDEPKGPGYLPLALPRTDRNPICRRCYRLRHYGRAEGRPLPLSKAGQQIARALARAEAVVLVADLVDFEGSLPPAGLLPPDKPIILAVNKVDLLPPKTAVREVTSWAGRRWEAIRPGARAVAVASVSAARGVGLTGLVDQMLRWRGHRQVLALVGATSVGKSTLTRRLLAEAETEGEPTVSRFPGTTQGASRWHLDKLDLTLYDTPGFVPGDRLIDLLCPSCAAQLVPARTLARTLFLVASGQAAVFGGLAAFVLKSGEARDLTCYTSGQVVLHRAGPGKAEELLASRPEWLLPWACTDCRPARAYRRVEIGLAPGEDLVVAGLGWISLRGGPAVVEVILPAGVRLVRRPGLFGSRR